MQVFGSYKLIQLNKLFKIMIAFVVMLSHYTAFNFKGSKEEFDPKISFRKYLYFLDLQMNKLNSIIHK